METNNKRAKIILERVTKEKTNAAQEELKKPMKKKLGWKMITAICVAAVIFVGAISGLIVGLTLAGRFDLNNMFITNFTSYSALGVGEKNAASPENIASAYDGDEQIASATLVGINIQNEVEELRFSKDKNDKVGHSINPKVLDFHAFKDYSIVTFDIQKNDTRTFYQDGMFSIYESARNYLIDNRTGKFYSLDGLPQEFFYYSHEYSSASGMRYKIYDSYESDSAIYFYTPNNNIYINKIFKVQVVNGELVISVVFDYAHENLLIKKMFVDKFDNIFLTGTEGNYIMKSGGGIARVDNNDLFYKSINGIAYHFTDSGSGDDSYIETADKMINKDGEIVDTDFSGGNVRIDSQFKIKSIGNVDYYFYTLPVNKSAIAGGNGYDKIRKVTWLDDEHINFKYEEIEPDLKDAKSPQCVITNDSIYFRLSDKILKVEITTGKTETLASDYIFTDIKTDNLGNVRFRALDSNAQVVNGIIDNNGNITTTVQPQKYEVYYIKPLN